MEMILIRGLPGSGKSTTARRMLQHSYDLHVEADQYFMQTGKYEFDADKLGTAHAWCQYRTREWLTSSSTEQRRVIVSNTFTTIRELQPYFEMAKELNIVPTVILCQNRFQSIHSVPEATILKMAARFQYDIRSLFAMFM
jgi:predicted kinase